MQNFEHKLNWTCTSWKSHLVCAQNEIRILYCVLHVALSLFKLSTRTYSLKIPFNSTGNPVNMTSFSVQNRKLNTWTYFYLFNVFVLIHLGRYNQTDLRRRNRNLAKRTTMVWNFPVLAGLSMWSLTNNKIFVQIKNLLRKKKLLWARARFYCKILYLLT